MLKKILLVDDDPVMRTLFKDLLGSYGHQVDTAENPHECIEYLRSEAAPDILFIDFIMPQKSGLELLAEIRTTFKDTIQSKIPVALLTATLDMRELPLQDGVVPEYFLSKPFDLKAVAKLLQELP